MERLAADAPDQAVRVLALGQEQKTRLAAVAHDRQGIFECPPGGTAPGRITVEAEYDFVDDPVQTLQVFGCGGGPQGGDRVAEAELG